MILFQLSDLRRSVVSLLGLDSSTPDYEIVSKLSKLINAHREYTLVSRRYDDPVRNTGGLSPRYTTLDHGTTASRHLTFDNTRFYDSILDDVDENLNASYNKRPTRNL